MGQLQPCLNIASAHYKMVSGNTGLCSSCFTITFSEISNCLTFGKIFIWVSVSSWVPQETDSEICRPEFFADLCLGTAPEKSEGNRTGQKKLNCDVAIESSAILGWLSKLSLVTRIPPHPPTLQSIVAEFSLLTGSRPDFGHDGSLQLMATSGKGLSWEQPTLPTSGGTRAQYWSGFGHTTAYTKVTS